MATKNAVSSVSIDLLAKEGGFENLDKNLELNFQDSVNKTPFLIVVLRDFNERMQGWYQNDTTAFEGSKTNIATSQLT